MKVWEALTPGQELGVHPSLRPPIPLALGAVSGLLGKECGGKLSHGTVQPPLHPTWERLPLACTGDGTTGQELPSGAVYTGALSALEGGKLLGQASPLPRALPFGWN